VESSTLCSGSTSVLQRVCPTKTWTGFGLIFKRTDFFDKSMVRK